MTIPERTVKKVKGDIRREQIVQAAIRIIGQKGVSSVTTSALGREVGISEANLYRHFKNKDDIYFAAVDHVRDMITGNVEKAFLSGSDPLIMLKRFFGLQIDLLAENSGIPRFMFSEELHIHQSLREKILKTMYTVSDRLAILIKDAQKAGSIRGDIDPRTTALMFIAIIQGLAFRWSLGGFSFSVVAEGKKTWSNFEKFITAKQA